MSKPDRDIEAAARCLLTGDQAGWRRHNRRLRARYSVRRINQLLAVEKSRQRQQAAARP